MIEASRRNRDNTGSNTGSICRFILGSMMPSSCYVTRSGQSRVIDGIFQPKGIEGKSCRVID